MTSCGAWRLHSRVGGCIVLAAVQATLSRPCLCFPLRPLSGQQHTQRPPASEFWVTAAPSLCGSQITNCSSRLPDSSAAPGRLGRVCFCSCVSYEARARCCLRAMHWRPGGNKRDERFAVHCHLSCLLVAWRAGHDPPAEFGGWFGACAAGSACLPPLRVCWRCA